MENADYDYVVIGSGFGGSVSALRLAEKGYSVLVVEKGKHYQADNFPKTNWNLPRWLWIPGIRFFGFFKITFLRHIGILSGVGVGGGSLVYANTLPRPDPAFFQTGNWAGINDWEKELHPYYHIAERMLGVAKNPGFYDSDDTLRKLSAELKSEYKASPTSAGVYFGDTDREVPDPYFNGEGPSRSGCNFCGGCMTGCRFNAKNSLDKNYLFLAQRKGARILAEHKVRDVRPVNNPGGSDGYKITIRKTTGYLPHRNREVKCRGVVFAGGVLGTVRLLLDLRRKSMPNISHQAGDHIRTNNESLILVTTSKPGKDLSKGIAIGSIMKADEYSHVEAVRYGSGSGFWKWLGAPIVYGDNLFVRAAKLLWILISRPWSWMHIYFTKNFAKESIILLFMQHLDSSLKFKRGWFTLRTTMTNGPAPTAFIPLARKLAEKTASILGGQPFVLITEALTGIPTTAHILGGSVIGRNAKEGVIDADHRLFGYNNVYVCDGSAISANPGVNPSLTITAMAERAMSKIPDKSIADGSSSFILR